MVSLSVGLGESATVFLHNVPGYLVNPLADLVRDYFTSIFCDKNQMEPQPEYAMVSPSESQVAA